jgi:hypothetical protein
MGIKPPPGLHHMLGNKKPSPLQRAINPSLSMQETTKRPIFGVGFAGAKAEKGKSPEDIIKEIALESLASEPERFFDPKISAYSYPSESNPTAQATKPQNQGAPQGLPESIDDITKGIADKSVPPIKKNTFLEKLRSLEKDLTRPVQAQKPTNIADVIGAVSQVLGGGKEVDQGKRDFMGSLLDVISNIGGYASSGQGRTILGVATKNKPLLASGLDRLNVEQGFQSVADAQTAQNLSELRQIYGAEGKALGEAGGQRFDAFTYRGADGLYRLAQRDKLTGELIQDESKDPIVKQPSNTVTDLMVDGKVVKGVYNQAAQRWEDASGAPLGRQIPLQKSTDASTGEEEIFNPATGQSTLTPKSPSQNWTPAQSKTLISLSSEMRNSSKSAKATIADASSARNMLDNPASMEALKTKLSRMSGDVGNIAVAEKAGYGGAQDIKSRINQAYSTRVNGKFSPENRRYINELISILEKSAKEKLANEKQSYKDQFLSMHPDATPSLVDKYFSIIAGERGEKSGESKSPQVQSGPKKGDRIYVNGKWGTK